MEFKKFFNLVLWLFSNFMPKRADKFGQVLGSLENHLLVHLNSHPALTPKFCYYIFKSRGREHQIKNNVSLPFMKHHIGAGGVPLRKFSCNHFSPEDSSYPHTSCFSCVSDIPCKYFYHSHNCFI